MSLGQFYANPIIIINLGAEMIYIIDQRLRAQQIAQDKAIIVLNDLITTLFSLQFIPALFKPSRTYSQNFTKKLFDQIAHCSIMKLNENSMSKLYDLMIMNFKRQIVLSSSPHEIYHITQQHFQGVFSLIKQDQTQSSIQTCRNNFFQLYQKFSPADYIQIRNELLRYVGGKQIRVQMFLQNACQNQDGTFKIHNDREAGIGIRKPGEIIIYQQDGSVKSRKTVAIKASQDFKASNFKLVFDGNQTDLAKNLYLTDEQIQEQNKQSEPVKGSQIFQQSISKNYDLSTQSEHAKKELNSIASLIKGNNIPQNDAQMQEYFTINVLKSQQSSVDGQSSHQHINEQKFDDFIIIEQSQSTKSNQLKSNIEKLFSENHEPEGLVQFQEDEEDDDLLALMDKASKK